MGTEEPDCKPKHELDDSGCVQDDSPVKDTAMENKYVGQAEMLDLSDDVLLCILKYLSPHDLKALGFTCPRLGSLVLERSLWTRVDARTVQYGRQRTRWLLNALHAGTKELLLTGLAGLAKGCLGHVNRTRKEVEDEKAGRKRRRGLDGDGDSNLGDNIFMDDILAQDPARDEGAQNGGGMEPPFPLFRQHARLHINAHHLPRLSGSPSWPDEYDAECACTATQSQEPRGCPGPQFTLSQSALRVLRDTCPHLSALSLDYCNINCNKTNIQNFPASLKKLSLRGSKCYNMPLDKSFLFKIHDYLPLIEYLDLSECEWLEPAALLPLSKIPTLETLLMRDCPGMTEFVAYVSLATRYGFRKLQELDFSGSPVGDSEVSALGWLPALSTLRLAAPSAPPPRPAPPGPLAAHAHYRGDEIPAHTDLALWETQEPEYFTLSNRVEPQSPDTSFEDVESQLEQLRENFEQPTDMISIEVHTRPREAPLRLNRPERPRSQPNPTKRHHSSTPDEDHSKRTKSEKDNPGNSDSEDMEKRKKCGISDDSDDKKEHKKCGDSDNSDDKKKQEKCVISDDSEAGPSKCVKQEIDDKNSANCEPGPSNDDKNDKSKGNSDERPCKRARQDKTDSDKPVSPKGQFPYGSGYVTIIRDPEVVMQVRKQQENSERRQRSLYSSERNRDMSNDNPSNESNNNENINNDGSRRFERRFDINVGASTSSYSISVSVRNDCGDEPGSSHRHVDLPAQRNTEETQSEPNKSDTENTKAKEEKTSDETNSSGEGTSRSSSSCNSSSSSSSNERPSPQELGRCEQYVRFRENHEPVVITRPIRPDHRPEPENLEPRHHVLYVNLGQQLHAVYRLLPNRPFFRSIRNRYRSPSTERLDSSSLVTDSAIRGFGRADGEDVNVVNIGPNGPQFGGRIVGGRPNRSNLRVLIATGYRSITNRSLVHLASAAPHLETIDFTNTGVTEAGVESFKTIRPDCEVKFSPFQEEKTEE